jgi:hypothetical protein
MAWYVYHTTAGSIVILRDSAPSVSKTSLTACYLLLLDCACGLGVSMHLRMLRKLGIAAPQRLKRT